MYSWVLSDLTEKQIRDEEPKEQAGVRLGRFPIESTNKITCEKRVQRNRELHIALVHLERVYIIAKYMGSVKEGWNITWVAKSVQNLCENHIVRIIVLSYTEDLF